MKVSSPFIPFSFWCVQTMGKKLVKVWSSNYVWIHIYILISFFLQHGEVSRERETERWTKSGCKCKSKITRSKFLTAIKVEIRNWGVEKEAYFLGDGKSYSKCQCLAIVICNIPLFFWVSRFMSYFSSFCYIMGGDDYSNILTGNAYKFSADDATSFAFCVVKVRLVY